METLQYLGGLFFVFLLISYKLLSKNMYKQKKNLPPGPPSLPIIGHFHLLKQPLHKTLATLSDRYGPILFLRFGSRAVVIVSSPSTVAECFTKNDVVFANRPHLLVGKHLGYNFTNMAFAPYGDLWRNLRRVTATEIFSSIRLQMSSGIRTEEVRFLTRQLLEGSENGMFRKVELKSKFFKLMFNIVTGMIGVKRYFGEEDMEDTEKARHRMDYIKETFYTIGLVAFGDFFPFLRWFDFWMVEKKMVKLHHHRDLFIQCLIDENRRSRPNYSSSSSMGTIMDALLSLQETDPEYYTDDIIKGILEIMFGGATDTSSATMEWAMSLLLNHPEVLQKARDEIDIHVEQGRLLDESDLAKLPYLHNIINETLRVCTVGTFPVPHESVEDCSVGGFDIPRGTMLLVNIWAIHNDPNVWVEPTMFKPERFESETEGFKFIPFMVGRRVCPGAGLAIRAVALTLGTLIQCFDWERVGEEMVDMSAGSGLPLVKATPLEAMYRPRKTMLTVLSQL